MFKRTDGRAKRVTMTITEAAELLGLSVSATYEAATRGDIPVIRIGRRVLVKRQKLLTMLEIDGQPASPRSSDR